MKRVRIVGVPLGSTQNDTSRVNEDIQIFFFLKDLQG